MRYTRTHESIVGVTGIWSSQKTLRYTRTQGRIVSILEIVAYFTIALCEHDRASKEAKLRQKSIGPNAGRAEARTPSNRLSVALLRKSRSVIYTHARSIVYRFIFPDCEESRIHAREEHCILYQLTGNPLRVVYTHARVL